jgi:hypothetical protein
VRPAGTPCTADANPCTLDQCDGAVATCTHLPDNANPACIPTSPAGVNPGDTVVAGQGNPACMGGVVTVLDCGPEVPPICGNGNDIVLGTGSKAADGSFMITVPPLAAGQLIVITDGCTRPALRGAPLRVGGTPAPLLSAGALVAAAALLTMIGGAAMVRRRREARSRR